MSEFAIAPATSADLTDILQITRQTFEAHKARNPRAFPENDWKNIEEMHRIGTLQADGEPRSFLARRNREFLGFVLLAPSYEMGMIYDIGVRPEARETGVGKALLKHAIAFGRQQSWTLLIGSVWDGNEASHRLFKRAGFTPGKPLLGKLSGFLPKLRYITYSYDLSTPSGWEQKH